LWLRLYVLFNDMTLFIMVFQMMAEDVLVSRALAISCSKYSIFERALFFYNGKTEHDLVSCQIMVFVIVLMGFD